MNTILNYINSNTIFGVGYLVLLSSILTILLVMLVKKILNKKGKLNNLDSTQKDYVISHIGRYTALGIYTIVFLINEFVFTHSIEFNDTFLTEIVGGATIILQLQKEFILISIKLLKIKIYMKH